MSLDFSTKKTLLTVAEIKGIHVLWTHSSFFLWRFYNIEISECIILHFLFIGDDNITLIFQTGLLDDIAKGLLSSQLLISFVSDEYAASSNSMTELNFAALTLQIPIVLAVVGQGDNWKKSEVSYSFIFTLILCLILSMRGCRGRDHMVVGFTITYAIIAYHH